jgi:pimeloyl-ACP methyl ester carboxylesterase
MRGATRQRLRLSVGTELSFITAGESSRPALLLLHGFPNAARMFGEVVPELSQTAYVIAPDLPALVSPTSCRKSRFPAFGQAISELLDRLAIGPRYIYLFDWGLQWGSHRHAGAGARTGRLIVQNANAR